ncbi:MAG: hypothetical protein EHM93_02515 [Bacteroidales bacterium]|nr:MAG: hypothetical protein EHM93_02515 [Bacteroidales bacterium]
MEFSNDILQQLFAKHPFRKEKIAEIIFGTNHCAICLTNGNIGVCSTLGIKLVDDVDILANPDFKRIEHRAVVNAWINANANYTLTPNGNGNIFDAIDFTRYKGIVMIGYFESLANRFKELGIDITVFDLDSAQKPVESVDNQSVFLSKADAVVLTATSIFNKTYNKVLAESNPNADIFMLGPSTPLDSLMFSDSRLKLLFGTLFNENDSRILEIIRLGGSAKIFLPLAKKVYFCK